MRDNGYNPKPRNHTRCIICGEEAANDSNIIGCQRVKGGKVCVHISCWEKEQTELRVNTEKEREDTE